MTEPRRTKRELAMIEQEKAHAFRLGGAAFRQSTPLEQNPFQQDTEEHKFRAWLRGYDSERRIRTEINPRERRP